MIIVETESAFSETITQLIKTEGSFTIPCLGTFTIKSFAARNLKHAKLGHIIQLPARKVLTFKQSKEVRKAIN